MLIRQTLQRQRRSAFTLMEMLVVVAIIVALAGIGGFFLLGAMKGAQEDIAKTQVKGALTTACQNYYLNNMSQFPPSLAVLLQTDQFGKGPYLENPDALMDPWGQPYQYNQQGPNNNNRKPDIWTVSPTTGKQIGNWPHINANGQVTGN